MLCAPEGAILIGRRQPPEMGATATDSTTPMDVAACPGPMPTPMAHSTPHSHRQHARGCHRQTARQVTMDLRIGEQMKGNADSVSERNVSCVRIPSWNSDSCPCPTLNWLHGLRPVSTTMLRTESRAARPLSLQKPQQRSPSPNSFQTVNQLLDTSYGMPSEMTGKQSGTSGLARTPATASRLGGCGILQSMRSTEVAAMDGKSWNWLRQKP